MVDESKDRIIALINERGAPVTAGKWGLSVQFWSESTALVFISERQGRAAAGGRAKAAGGSPERAPSRAAAACSGPSGSCDAPRGFSAAAKRTRVPDGMFGDQGRNAASARAVSCRPFLGAMGPCAPHRGSDRRTGAVGGRSQRCDSHRALREPTRHASGALLGGPLARTRPRVTARGACRARLRIREFSEAFALPARARGGRILLRHPLRRLARPSERCGSATRGCGIARIPRRGGRRRAFADVARKRRVAASRAARDRRSAVERALASLPSV
jgi:hypothetical protein